MRSHYTFLSTLSYYRSVPTSVELKKAEAGYLDLLSSDGSLAEHAGRTVSLKSLGANLLVDAIAVGEEKRSKGPFDFSRWKDEPHVALANLRDDAAAVLRFTRTYGVLRRGYKGESTLIGFRDVFQFRDVLRRAWEGDDDALWQMIGDVKALLWVRSSGMDIIVEDLRTLIQVMFARDHRDGIAKKCANPDCLASPYFRAVRKGQKFCSHNCAVLINVRRFRKAAKKLSTKGGN